MRHHNSEEQGILRLVAAFCALAGAILWAGPNIFRADLFADDAAQHTFWLYRYADPALLPNDLTARFFSLSSTAPWGYRTLYALIAPHMDVLLAGEILAALLFLASLTLAWLIGRAVASEGHRDLGGLIGTVTLLCLIGQPSDALTTLALQRSFALPITLLFLWGALTRRYVWIGVSWLLCALFYPVIVVVLGLAGGIVLLLDLLRDRRLPPAFWWNAVAGVAAIAIVYAGLGTPPDIGPQLSGREALAMPEFGDHGRLQLFFGTFSGNWIRNQLVGIGWSPATILITAAAAALATVVNREARLPRVAWVLALTGLAVWAIARVMMFTLYLPNRHTRWSFAAFAIAAIAAGGVIVIARLTERMQRPLLSSILVSVAAIGIAAAVLVPPSLRAWRTPVNEDMERVYAYLATLPKDALIAAQPDIADFIPLRSHRSVLASTETSLPFMRGYYESLRPRLEASLRAAYASSWEEMDSALAPYGVSVMVTAPGVWENQTYYEPYDRLVAELKAHAAGRDFILRKPSGDRVLFQSGGVYVVRVQRSATRSE